MVNFISLPQKYKYKHKVVKKKKKLTGLIYMEKANQRMIEENLWFLSFSGERNSDPESTHWCNQTEEGEKTATRFSYMLG